MILRIVESASELVFEPLPEDDPKRRKPDISRAQQLLNWSPEVPVEEGLAQTLAYFKTYALDQVA